MIKIISAKPTNDFVVHLVFSDGGEGDYDLSPLIAKKSSLTKMLEDQIFFKRLFIELGALCWPNGFELSAEAIHQELSANKKLRYTTKAA